MDRVCRQTIRLAFHEDIKTGDITTAATVPRNKTGTAIVVAKSDGLLSGIEAFSYALKLASPKIDITFHQKEGRSFKAGKKIATIKGPSQALLKGERLALNLLSRLSGVATMTAKFVSQVRGTGAKILDTRKTSPGLRWLEKKAVVHGGGYNHRMGLYDMILIKDNHIAAAGGIGQTLNSVQKSKHKVEIEISNLRQLDEALAYAPDMIMLDNFDIRRLSKAVRVIRSKSPVTKIEVSGGIGLGRVRALAKTGVDYISIGALTHSARAIDFSMRYIG